MKRNIKILYLEDEPSLAKIVSETLISKSFEVLHLPDGTRVVETFKSFQPHICILDVMLPVMDGFSIGKEIRKLNNTVPIIYLTAKSQTKDTLEGFSSGGNDYIKKPFSLEELLVRIHNLCAMRYNDIPNDQDDGISIGEYLFYYTRQELSHPIEIKRLSFREAGLLKLLSENSSDIVQRNDILANLWGDNSFFNSRNLDVYITRLRNYLRHDPNVKILTLKGVGYRLIE